MPSAPENLEPPEDVSPFPAGDAPAGFETKVLKMLPVIDHEELIRYFSQASGLQKATTLTEAQLSEWFHREWSVQGAVVDSFNGTSPFSKADEAMFGATDYSGINLTSPTAWAASHKTKSLAGQSLLQPHLVGGGGTTLRGVSPGGSRASYNRSMGGASGPRSLAPSVQRNQPSDGTPSLFRRAPSVIDNGVQPMGVADLRSALASVAPPTPDDDSSSVASGEGGATTQAYEEEVAAPATARGTEVQSVRSSIRSARGGGRRRATGVRRRGDGGAGDATVSQLLDSLHVSASPTIAEDSEPPASAPIVPPYAA